MNIALIGFGKMGQEIARLAQGKHAITVVVDHHTHEEIARLGATHYSNVETADFSGVDVAIEFSHPTSALAHIEQLAAQNVNTVVGTTGWYDQLPRVEKIIADAGTGLLWASNFSIGVHLFWKMIERAAQDMNRFEEYDVFGHEFHHRHKADAPSGTARTTADILLKNIDRKTKVLTDTPDRAIAPEELHFSSTRGGSIPGTHSVFFDSLADTIEITHTARNRSGFASGALRCAEWLNGKSGLFSIEDYLKSL